MSHIFIIFLLALTLMSSRVHAIDAPERPEVISPYVRSVLDEVELRLRSIQSSQQSCEAEKEEQYAANSLRSLFFGASPLAENLQYDSSRTACFYHDASQLERYVSSLILKSIVSASNCDLTASRGYADQAHFVWGRLWALRASGLRPDLQEPITGTGKAIIPSGATPESDDALCPYHSAYASPGLNMEGCQRQWFSNQVPSALHREMLVMQNILSRISMRSVGTSAGLPTELSFFRRALVEIWMNAALHVDRMSRVRFLRPLIYADPDLTPQITSENVGESGCIGWPSSVTRGKVTGEGMSLHSSFPFLLNKDLSETVQFLNRRRERTWLEYLKRGSGAFLASPFMSDINRMHLDMESMALLSIRDPQIHNENIANDLHQRTRQLVGQVATLPGSPPNATAGPPLRDFIRRYARFLSRMCINRGCEEPLIRAIELSLRDECFSAFFMDRFFRERNGNGTLPACEAVFLK